MPVYQCTTPSFSPVSTSLQRFLFLYLYLHIYRISYRKLAWVRVEPMTIEFCSFPLTDRAIRPWVQLALRANFVQLSQFHFLFSVRLHFGYCLYHVKYVFPGLWHHKVWSKPYLSYQTVFLQGQNSQQKFTHLKNEQIITK